MINLHCETCNFTTNRNPSWLKHIASQKHNRNGKNKSTKCDICNYESTSPWNNKIHKLYNHTSKEDRQIYENYCKYCDILLVCKSYYEKHLESNKHKKYLKINN